MTINHALSFRGLAKGVRRRIYLTCLVNYWILRRTQNDVE